MTAPARITDADFGRASKAASAAAKNTGNLARVIFRLEAREIEMIFGDSVPNELASAITPKNTFDED